MLSSPRGNKSGKKSNVRFDDATIIKDENKGNSDDTGGLGPPTENGYQQPSSTQGEKPVSFFLDNSGKNAGNVQQEGQIVQRPPQSKFGFFTPASQLPLNNTPNQTTGSMFLNASQKIIETTQNMNPVQQGTEKIINQPKAPTGAFFSNNQNVQQPPPAQIPAGTNLKMGENPSQQLNLPSGANPKPRSIPIPQPTLQPSHSKMSVPLPQKLLSLPQTSNFKSTVLPSLSNTGTIISEISISSHKLAIRASNTVSHKVKIADAAIHTYTQGKPADFRHDVRQLDIVRLQLACVMQSIAVWMTDGQIEKAKVVQREGAYGVEVMKKGVREVGKVIERTRELVERMEDRREILRSLVRFMKAFLLKVEKVAAEEISRREEVKRLAKERSKIHKGNILDFGKVSSSSGSILFGSQKYNIQSSKVTLGAADRTVAYQQNHTNTQIYSNNITIRDPQPSKHPNDLSKSKISKFSSTLQNTSRSHSTADCEHPSPLLSIFAKAASIIDTQQSECDALRNRLSNHALSMTRRLAIMQKWST